MDVTGACARAEHDTSAAVQAAGCMRHRAAETSIVTPASSSDLKKARTFLPILSGGGMREFACSSPSPSYTNTQRSSESQNLENVVDASLFWLSLVSLSGFISLPHLSVEPAVRDSGGLATAADRLRHQVGRSDTGAGAGSSRYADARDEPVHARIGPLLRLVLVSHPLLRSSQHLRPTPRLQRAKPHAQGSARGAARAPAGAGRARAVWRPREARPGRGAPARRTAVHHPRARRANS